MQPPDCAPGFCGSPPAADTGCGAIGGGGDGGGNAEITGAGPPVAASGGSVSNSVALPLCSFALLASTDCKTQPRCASPVRRRTALCVVVSMKTASAGASPSTVPTRIRSGCRAGGGGGGGGGTGLTATAAAGGRRDGENSGRSRVAVKALSGMAQSGFEVVAGFAAASAL